MCLWPEGIHHHLLHHLLLIPASVVEDNNEGCSTSYQASHPITAIRASLEVGGRSPPGLIKLSAAPASSVHTEMPAPPLGSLAALPPFPPAKTATEKKPTFFPPLPLCLLPEISAHRHTQCHKNAMLAGPHRSIYLLSHSDRKCPAGRIFPGKARGRSGGIWSLSSALRVTGAANEKAVGSLGELAGLVREEEGKEAQIAATGRLGSGHLWCSY